MKEEDIKIELIKLVAKNYNKILTAAGIVIVFSNCIYSLIKLCKMKRTLMLLLFSMAILGANAQRGNGYNNHHHQPQYGGGYHGPQVVFSPTRFGCNNNYRRPFINVVIAPRPRVVVTTPPPQPQVVREWVEAHWEEGQYGRVWVEGHYVQREVY